MKNKEEVERLEELGMQRLKSLLANNFDSNYKIVHTMRAYDQVDIQMTGHGETYDIEIKCRDVNSNDYKDYMIESSKLIGLMNFSNNHKKYYINFFADGYALVWDIAEINNIDQYRGESFCCKTTVDDSARVKKAVYYLPSKLAKKYKYKYDYEKE